MPNHPFNVSTGDIRQSSLAAGSVALAISTQIGPSIRLYNEKYEQVAKVETRGAGLLTFGENANLYLVGANTGSLWIYKPPYDGTPQQIQFPYIVGWVAIDPKTDILAVAGNYDNQTQGPAISFFRPGASTPCNVVNFPNNSTLSFIAFDETKTVFASWNSTLVSISGECAARTYQTYSDNPTYIGEMQFNSKDQLLIDTSFQGRGPIVTYAHPSKGVLGKPIYRTYLDKIDGEVEYLDTLSEDGKHLWAGDYFKGGVGYYAYPAGGAPSKIISVNDVWGAAVFPPVP